MYELEVKLYNSYCSPLFVSFLIDYFKSSLSEIIEDTSYIFDDNIRYIKGIEGNIIKTQKDIIIEKKMKDSKFTIANEKDLTIEAGSYDLTKCNHTRKRKRMVYNFLSEISLHITQINGDRYEVEIEQETDNINDSTIEEFNKKFEDLMKIIEPFSVHFKRFLNLFNNDDSSKNPYKMSWDVISQARDIEKNDFITENGKGIPEGYTFTIKSNGIPILLYFKNGCMYKISHEKYFHLHLEEERTSPEEFIIIGEYFEEISTFTPFDILYWSRQVNIRNHPDHLERMDHVKDILDRNKIYLKDINIFYKPFLDIGSTPESFAKTYIKIKSMKYPFEDDGIIMTPRFTSHNPQVPKISQLSKGPETCKIKPWHEKSIDFRVNLTKKEVYASCSTTDYTGSDKFKFNSKVNIDWESIPKELNNEIVELSPFKDEVRGTILMKFSRYRKDKLTPNGKKTIDKIWKQIIDPLPIALFLAKDFSRLRFQNNRVKKLLIDTIPKKSIVVDIGSGRGGDIHKYNGIADIVLCIEPDEINLIELNKRIASFEGTVGAKTKFVVVQCLGQDTDIIMEKFNSIRNQYPTNPVAIVSMLSLTFFWENRKVLDMFENTLTSISKASLGLVKFHFFTIEGHRFLKYFSENNNKIINYGLKAQYDPTSIDNGVGIPGRLKVQLPDTIVRPQREYLVDLNDLKCLKDITVKEALIEKYLTVEETKYGQTHVYGFAIIES